MSVRCAIVFVLALRSVDSMAEERGPSPQMLVGSDGRTMAAPVVPKDGEPIRIRIMGFPSPASCISEFKEIAIPYQYAHDATEPQLLSPGVTAAPTGSNDYTIPAPPHGMRFVLYNVWQQWKEKGWTGDAAKACVQERRKTEDTILQPRFDAFKDADAALRTITGQVAVLKVQIADLESDAKTFQNVQGPTSSDHVARIQVRLNDLRSQLLDRERELKRALAKTEEAKKALSVAEAAAGATLASFREETDRLSDYAANGKRPPAVARKVGGYLASPRAKGVYFDLAQFTAEDVIAVAPLGPHPEVQHGDTLHTVLLNVLPRAYAYPFSLHVTAHAGAVINVAPVRPVFDVSAIKAGESAAEFDRRRSEPQAVTDENTYRDVFLPVVGSFAPNDYAEITVITQRLDPKDSKRIEVKLIEKARSPQFRALYRYSFSSGVIRTQLLTPTFTKVKVVDDDASTSDVNEARYRTDRREGTPRLLPMFLFTLYPKPVDVQARVGHERWIPAPTLGFAFSDPADEFFLGFSHELFRNTQLLWGWHLGRKREIVIRNEASEDRDATAPVTRDERDVAFAFGVTFNINVIKQIFK